MQNLKKLLKKHLEANNMSHYAFEKKTKLGSGFLTRLFNEYNHVPSLQNIMKIADELDYSLDLLLDRHKYIYKENLEGLSESPKPIFTNFKLARDIFIYIEDYIENNNIKKINIDVFLHILKEIYVYSTPKSKVDTQFADWLLHNKFSNHE